MKKIIIVGAGPAGCYLAQNLKLAGIASVILEEDPEVGRPVRCAGVLGMDVFEKTRLKIPRDSIKNFINGAVIHYKDKSFKLLRNKVACVVSREQFDQSLASGLDIRLGTKFLDLIRSAGNDYLLKTSQGELSADIVIGADGPFSVVRKKSLPEKLAFVPGYQITLKSQLAYPSDLIQVFFTRLFHEFVWLIPENHTSWRLGALGREPKEQVKDFLKKQNFQGEITNEFAGIIPTGLFKTVSRNIALVGDAAGQVKPLSGGGVYFGLKCAEILADCIKNGDLNKYDRLWKKQFSGEIRLGLRARATFEKTSQEVLKRLFDVLAEEAEKIAGSGQFEYHSTAFLKIIKNPKIYRLLWPLGWAYLKSFLR